MNRSDWEQIQRKIRMHIRAVENAQNSVFELSDTSGLAWSRGKLDGLRDGLAVTAAIYQGRY